MTVFRQLTTNAKRRGTTVAVAFFLAGAARSAHAQNASTEWPDTGRARVFISDFAVEGDTSRIPGLGSVFAGTLALEAAGIRGVHVVRAADSAPCVVRPSESDTAGLLPYGLGDYAITGRLTSDANTVRVVYTINKCEERMERALARGDTTSFTWSEASAGMSSVAGYVVRILAQDLATLRVSIRPTTNNSESDHLFQIIAQHIAAESEAAGLRIVPVDSAADYRIRWRIGEEVAGRRSIRLTIERLLGIVHSDTLLDILEISQVEAGHIPITRRAIEHIVRDAASRGLMRSVAPANQTPTSTPMAQGAQFDAGLGVLGDDLLFTDVFVAGITRWRWDSFATKARHFGVGTPAGSFGTSRIYNNLPEYVGPAI
jgi:hypothetical protein